MRIMSKSDALHTDIHRLHFLKLKNFFRKVKEKPKEVSASGETPDLVRDCNEVALAEEILAE